MGIVVESVLGVILCLPVLFFLGLRFYLANGRRCPCQNRLVEKTVLITGGSSGIGKAIATECAARGAKVIIACRNKSKSEAVVTQIRKKTKNEEVFFVELELSSLDSVRECVEYYCQQYEGLDVLVNNAAYMGPRADTKDGIEKSFQVNYLGHFLLTNLLMQRMRPNTSHPLRVINMGSDSFKQAELDFEDLLYKNTPYDIYGAYGRSKLALIYFTSELNYRYAHAGVTSVAVHPGAVKTGLLRHWPGQKGSLLRAASQVLFRTPEMGAQTVIYCATADTLQHVAGKLVADCRLMTAEEITKDFRSAERLWNISLSLTDLDKLPPRNHMENES